MSGSRTDYPGPHGMSPEEYQKAIDEGMEILYGGLIPLPTPDSPGGETPPSTPDELRKAADQAAAQGNQQLADFLRQTAEVIETISRQTAGADSTGPVAPGGNFRRGIISTSGPAMDYQRARDEAMKALSLAPEDPALLHLLGNLEATVIPLPTAGDAASGGGAGGAGDAGGEGADEGGRVGSGGILVYSDDRDERIVGYADGHAVDIGIDDFPDWFPKGPPSGAGADGGEGADEGGGEGTGAPPGGTRTRTLADVLKEGPPDGVPDGAKYDSGDWVYTDENGVQHRYNGRGMLMSQVVPGQGGAGSTVIHYGPGSVSIQQETADGWSVTTHYEVRDGQLVPKSSMMTRSGETYRYTYDENGKIIGNERVVDGQWRGQWDKEGNPTAGDGTPLTPNVYNRLPDGRGEPPDPFQNNPQLRGLISKEIERAQTDPKSTNLAPITIPSMSDRDFSADLFFGSGLNLLPPTGFEAVGPGTVTADGPPISSNPGVLTPLDPQLDTGGAAGGLPTGLSPAPSLGVGPAAPAAGGAPAGPDLGALHGNFHADQTADLAAFQANQAQDPNLLNHLQQVQQFEAAHDDFHVLFPFPPGSPLIPAVQEQQIHDQVDQAQANLQATQNLQAADLAAEQAQQGTDHTDFHTQNGIP